MERDNMLAGRMYNCVDKELVAERQRCRKLLKEFNALQPSVAIGRIAAQKVFKELFQKVGSGVYIEPPFQCDYGTNLIIGDNTYMNFNCCILDCNTVTIGSRVLFGPGVQIYAATHPTSVEQRKRGDEYALPVTICDDCWIGGGAIILPGITIGEGSTVGAGSVVTKDVEPFTVVAGNPAKFLRNVDKSCGQQHKS